MPKIVLPLARLVRLTPTFFMNERLTSAMRTWRLTWSGEATLSRLTTPTLSSAVGDVTSTPGLR